MVWTSAAVLSLSCVLGGCQCNMWALEELVTHPEGKKMGLVITLLQCVFICFVSLFDYALEWRPAAGGKSGGGSKKAASNKINNKTKKNGSQKEGESSSSSENRDDDESLSSWADFIPVQFVARELDFKMLATMGVMFSFMSITNNAVYGYNVSVPFHTVFRSGSLAISVLMGSWYFGKKYTREQLLCTAVVTVGVIVFALANNPQKKSNSSGEEHQQDVDSSDSFVTWAIGIFLLLCTSWAGPVLGLLQANLFAEAQQRTGTKKQRFKEAVFYGHLISGSVLLVTYLPQTITILTHFPPELVKPLMANLVSQLVCVRGVYALANVVSSFNVALALVIRKMLTLTFSLIYYGHYQKFSRIHYVSMVAAFGGAVLYTFLPALPAPTSEEEVALQGGMKKDDDADGETKETPEEKKKATTNKLAPGVTAPSPKVLKRAASSRKKKK